MFTTVSSLVSRLPELNDAHAWQVFEQRYSPLLKRYFIKWTRSEHLASDLTQDTIQRAVQGLRKRDFRQGEARLRDWIGGIAHNVLRNHRRRSSLRDQPGVQKTQFWADQPDPGAEAELLGAEARFDAIWVRTRLSALIRLAAETFDQRTLRCYFLVEIQRIPIKEVARRTGLSESAVFRKRRNVANWFLAVGPRFVMKWES